MKIPKAFFSFTGLQKNLAKANLKITFQAYVGLMVFTSILSGIVAFVGNDFISFNFTFGPDWFIPFFHHLAFATFTLMFGISSKARKIDANLPLTANFMAVLASAGMPPERIFRSLANVGDEFGLGEEMRRIIGDIELLGLDLNEPLRRVL